jgi:hypothetical protein
VSKKVQIRIGVSNTFELVCLADNARRPRNIRGHTRYGLWAVGKT